jgi:hypothetical protein
MPILQMSLQNRNSVQATQVGRILSAQNLVIVVTIAFLFSVCIDLLNKEKEPLQRLELIVLKDWLGKITPVAMAQLAIKYNCKCVLIFLSELSKNFNAVLT